MHLDQVEPQIRAQWALINALMATHPDLPRLQQAIAEYMSKEIENSGDNPSLYSKLTDAEQRVQKSIEAERRKRDEGPK